MSAIVDTLFSTLQQAPGNWTCRLALVEALCGENREDEAIEVLNEIETLPDDLTELTQAARAYGMVDPDSGLEVLSDLLTENPTFAPAHIEKANLSLMLGDAQTAKQHYFTAITFDQSLADPKFAEKLESAPVTETPVEAVEEISPVSIVEPVVVQPVEVPQVQEEPVAEYYEDAPEEIPQPVQPVPLSPPGARENLHYPTPGNIPVVPLSQSLAAAEASPSSLIIGETVPPPPINYVEDHSYLTPQHTPVEEVYENLSNVAVHPHQSVEAVTYDYQAPDDSIFEPTITPDDIYVSALVTEDGEDVASIQESIEWNRSQSKRQRSIAETKNKIQSLCIAITAMVAICLGLGLVAIALPRPNPPQIVASVLAVDADEPLEEQKIVQPKVSVPTPPPAMGAASMDTITATSVSEISMTSFETNNPGLGMADSGIDFGSSMTFGTGGSEAMFFGSKTSGKRFLFVLDNSKSMKPHQVKLRNDELERAFKTLRGVQYQVLLFAGGAHFAEKGWGVKKGSKGGNAPEEFTSPKGDYSFTSDGLFDFELKGSESKFPAPDWITASPSRLRKSVEFVKDTPLFGGTDWDTAIKIACLMDPPPDVIFFMSDGQDRKLDVPNIVKDSKRAGGPKINSIAMQTSGGAEAFAEIARRTQGDYTIVDKDGKPIDGFKFLKDPAEFKNRL